MDIALLWAGILAFAILVYALLDGFDLGVGILFPFYRDDDQKKLVIHTIAPVWDGNETWLVLGGGGLFAVFPLAYATVLPALYAPVIAMLLALVFRGVSMEFREKTLRGRTFWNWGFWLGSLTAAFSQGLMLGAFIQGIDIVNRTYVGGWFDWLTPFSILCGFAVVAGYSVLGAGWLLMKTEGPVRTLSHRLLIPLSLVMLALIAIVSIWIPFLDVRLSERWFSWPSLLYLMPIPFLVALIAFKLLAAIRSDDNDAKPFAYTMALFIVTYVGFAITTYPYVVPHKITIWEAAAPDNSLSFLLVGTVVLIPTILIYTAHTYWVFRGKVSTDSDGYH